MPSPKPPPLQTLYPWTSTPLISSAPMRLISTAPLACAVTLSQGLGFIGAGSDISTLSDMLTSARQILSSSPLFLSLTENPTTSILPIGVGFITWALQPSTILPILLTHLPSTIWLFAPRDPSHASLSEWCTLLRSSPNYQPQIWIQIGSVSEAISAALACNPDALIIQGSDAGGHGLLLSSASLITLLPEVKLSLYDLHSSSKIPRIPHLVAAGGIMTGSSVAAALALGADGVCMGTRYLAAEEAVVAKGYRNEVLRAEDGGQTTIRSKVYDTLRGTTEWPERYGGRGVVNGSYYDAMAGMEEEENKRLYNEAVAKGDEGWGEKGRMTTYAGTGVGLVRKVQSAKEITEEVRDECRSIISRLSTKTRH